MVKGISRRVVVVKSPDSDVFEEAIFIVKDEGAGREDILKEACCVANHYLKTDAKSYIMEKPICLVASGAAGAILMGICWAVAAFLGF